MKKIVITAYSSICSLGSNNNEIWENLKINKSGIKSFPDTLNLKSKIKYGAFIDFEPTESIFLNGKDFNRYDRHIKFSLNALEQLEIYENFPDIINSNRAGIILGVSAPSSLFFEEMVINNSINKRNPPLHLLSIIPSILTGIISEKLKIHGPNFIVSSACSSSNYAIFNAINLIKSGDIDLVITGGAEFQISNSIINGFDGLNALSKNHIDNPKNASQPFGLNRDGFVMGEGVSLLIIETEENALKNNRKIIAEIVDCQINSDAYNITAPNPNGEQITKLLNNILIKNGIKKEEIDLINAHATGTKLGDQAESNAIYSIFQNNIDVFATKSYTGHLLAGSAALETVICLKTLEEQLIIGSAFHYEKDPLCQINLIQKNKNKNIKYIINNSFGFGGTNSALLLKKYKE